MIWYVFFVAFNLELQCKRLGLTGSSVRRCVAMWKTVRDLPNHPKLNPEANKPERCYS